MSISSELEIAQFRSTHWNFLHESCNLLIDGPTTIVSYPTWSHQSGPTGYTNISMISGFTLSPGSSPFFGWPVDIGIVIDDHLDVHPIDVGVLLF